MQSVMRQWHDVTGRTKCQSRPGIRLADSLVHIPELTTFEKAKTLHLPACVYFRSLWFRTLEARIK